jgi:hypothetical protein
MRLLLKRGWITSQQSSVDRFAITESRTPHYFRHGDIASRHGHVLLHATKLFRNELFYFEKHLRQRASRPQRLIDDDIFSYRESLQTWSNLLRMNNYGLAMFSFSRPTPCETNVSRRFKNSSLELCIVVTPKKHGPSFQKIFTYHPHSAQKFRRNVQKNKTCVSVACSID